MTRYVSIVTPKISRKRGVIDVAFICPFINSWKKPFGVLFGITAISFV